MKKNVYLSRSFIVTTFFLIANCGVKGRPLPPEYPPSISHGLMDSAKDIPSAPQINDTPVPLENKQSDSVAGVKKSTDSTKKKKASKKNKEKEK
jgi:hypothetical protein